MNNYIYFVDKDYPDHFYCPIGYEIFMNPVLLSDGHTYEYDNISKWLKDNKKSPMTNLVLRDKILTPNKTLENMIKEFYDNHKIKKEYYFFNNKFKFKENKNLISLDKAEIFHKNFYYKGSLNNGLKNGEGNYNLFNKYEYNGNWLEGNKDGFGIIKFKNGDEYKGIWKNDKKHGNGLMNFNNKNFYVGEWLDDLKNGFGLFKYNNGDIYEGNWLNNLKNDKTGYLYFKNGDKVRGCFINDNLNYGDIFYNNSEVYSGNFLNHKRHGNGVFYYKDGKKHLKHILLFFNQNNFIINNINTDFNINESISNQENEAFSDIFATEDDLIFSDTVVYLEQEDNELVYDVKIVVNQESKDVYDVKVKQPNKNEWNIDDNLYKIDNYYKYDGNWSNNNKDGFGKMIYVNKARYVGNWENNLRCGKGIIYYSTKYKYDGEFKNNKREGNGKLIDNNDKVIYDGVWKDNLPCKVEKLN